MGNSIESRMPFMDYRLVEFLASVPPCYKMHDGWTKYIARLAFDGKLPNEICWRKDKMGWPIPEEYWFKGNLFKVLKKQILASKIITSINKRIDKKRNINSKDPIKKLIRELNVSMFEKVFIES